MSSSCGECTSCCTVPTLFYSPNIKSSDLVSAGINTWVRISKRVAKKRNPHLVALAKRGSLSPSYFRCTALTSSGCSIYETRPQVCSGYPVYNYTLEEFNNNYKLDEGSTEYTENCELISTILLEEHDEESFEEKRKEFVIGE